MAGIDKIDLSILIASIDNDLNNGVSLKSITPAKHNDLLSNVLTTLAFFGLIKYNIIPSGSPTNGQLSLDGNAFDTATRLRISKNSAQSQSVSFAIENIGAGSVLHIRDYNGNFGEFEVSGKTENGSFWDVDVTPNSGNPNYTPTSLQGHLLIFPSGDSANIMNTDLIMNNKRTQDLNETTLKFVNGEIILGVDAKIFIDDLRDLGTTGTDLTVDLKGGADAMTVVVDDNFTIEFDQLVIGSGFINLNIGAPGNFTMTTGSTVEWGDGIPQDISTTSGYKDRLYWTCDGLKVEVSLKNNIS